MMACRSVPVPAPTAGLTPPLSPVFTTQKVEGTVRSSSVSKDSQVLGRRNSGGRRRDNPADLLALRRENKEKNHMICLHLGAVCDTINAQAYRRADQAPG